MKVPVDKSPAHRNPVVRIPGGQKPIFNDINKRVVMHLLTGVHILQLIFFLKIIWHHSVSQSLSGMLFVKQTLAYSLLPGSYYIVCISVSLQALYAIFVLTIIDVFVNIYYLET